MRGFFLITKIFIVALVLKPCSGASAQLLDGHTHTPRSAQEVFGHLEDETVVLLGEHHGFLPHYENQRQAIETIAAHRNQVSVGLEFLERRFQSQVDDYLSGLLPESEFLRQVGWGSIPFDNYREQALWPLKTQGKTLALNARRGLTSKIAKHGLQSLTEDEKRELPHDFTLGNHDYRERFLEVMGDHAPPDVIDRYFAAQSVWDEVMADTACAYIKQNPKQVLVIVVGEFHVAYGGGLPDRLRARGCSKQLVISLHADTPSAPHPRWGARGDYLWINETSD